MPTLSWQLFGMQACLKPETSSRMGGGADIDSSKLKQGLFRSAIAGVLLNTYSCIARWGTNSFTGSDNIRVPATTFDTTIERQTPS